MKKKYKRYQYGTASAIASGVDQLAQPFLDPSLTANEFGYSKNMVGKSTAAGALKGAAIGANPVLMAATGGLSVPIAGLLGAGAGYLGGKKKKNQALDAEKQFNAARDMSRSVYSQNQLQGYDTTGGQEEESLYAYGGKLKKLSNGAALVDGRTHAEGGVKFPGLGIELEDNETVTDDNFVFSDKLGFADKHKSLAKMMGKIEKKPMSKGRTNTLALLEKKEQALMNEQESLKSLLGIDNDGKMMYGGKYKTYQMGGDPKKPRKIPVVENINTYNKVDTVGTGLPLYDRKNHAVYGNLAKDIGSNRAPGLEFDPTAANRAAGIPLLREAGDTLITRNNLLETLNKSNTLIPASTKPMGSLQDDALGVEFTKFYDQDNNLFLNYNKPIVERAEKRRDPVHTSTEFYASGKPLGANELMNKYKGAKVPVASTKRYKKK